MLISVGYFSARLVGIVDLQRTPVAKEAAAGKKARPRLTIRRYVLSPRTLWRAWLKLNRGAY
jgi:hypothetical protein